MDVLNRAYIGVRLSPSLQQQLVQVQTSLRHRAGSDAVRWIPPAEMLLTIMTLGELSVASLQNIARQLPPILANYATMELCVEGLVGQPNNLQPRFVSCGLTGDVEQLTRMHNELEMRLKPFLQSYESKPFQPLISLGRIKMESEQSRTDLGRAIKMAHLGQVAPLSVSTVELLRIASTGAGPTFMPIESYQLRQ